MLTPPASAGRARPPGRRVRRPRRRARSVLGLAGAGIRRLAGARGAGQACRIDLDPLAFPVGTACATIMAQVPVILVALASGLLLLTPATTARHFHEWLVSASRLLGFEPPSQKHDAAVSDDCRGGEQLS
jgi:hypothetical protein